MEASQKSRPVLGPTVLDPGDEGGDRTGDRLRAIFLQKMHARSELDEPAIVEVASEFFREALG
jgi:hypothetical protein